MNKRIEDKISKYFKGLDELIFNQKIGLYHSLLMRNPSAQNDNELLEILDGDKNIRKRWDEEIKKTLVKESKKYAL